MQNGNIELELFLTNVAGSKSVRIIDRYKLTSGAIQENWALDVEFSGGPLTGLQELCLRMDAPTRISNSRSRIEEFALLTLAYKNGIRVPEPLFPCKDKKIIGRQFFIMRRIPGIADARRITQIKRTIHQQDKLLSDLGTQLAAIHALKPSGREMNFLKKPHIAPALHVINQYHAALDALPQPAPVLEWGLRWAQLNLPREQIPTICHRDFRTGNLMIDGNNLIGILDWEFAGWSDPMEDVAWFCAKCWRFGLNNKEAGGMGSRTAFYNAYENASRRKIDHKAIIFWEVMAHIRWAIIARQQGERFATSGENSLEPAMTAFIAPQLEWEVMRMTENWANEN